MNVLPTSRRRFLKKSIQASAVLGALGTTLPFYQSAAQGKTQRNIKKCLKYGMVEEEGSILEKFKLLKELGFDGVEMDGPNDLDKDEILEAKEKTGLEIPGVIDSVHWKLPLSDPDPAIREKSREGLITALHDCKKYGGSTVLLVPGVVSKEVSYDTAYKNSQEEIKKVLPLAKELDIKIALENVWNNFLISPLEAARYVDEFEDPMIGWYMDIGNIVRYGWPEQWIRILGKRILKLDIKEYSRKKQQEEGIWKGFDVNLLEGDCDWPAVMKAIDEIGYEGWGSAEVPGGGRERLKDISERMDKIFSS